MKEWKVGDKCQIVETNIEDVVCGEYHNEIGTIQEIANDLQHNYLVLTDSWNNQIWCSIKEIEDDEEDLISKGPQLPEDRSGEPESFSLEGGSDEV